jgi:hypothetical protein
MKKISLLKDCFSKETRSGKSDKDEMIIYERNKISHVGMTILTGVFVLYGILSEKFDLHSDSQYICMCIGIVNYIMLITYCKKGIVKHFGAVSSFIWSILTLPLSIVNLFLDKFIQGKIYGIIAVITMIIVALILYFICNIIYKKSFDED